MIPALHQELLFKKVGRGEDEWDTLSFNGTQRRRLTGFDRRRARLRARIGAVRREFHRQEPAAHDVPGGGGG